MREHEIYREYAGPPPAYTERDPVLFDPTVAVMAAATTWLNLNVDSLAKALRAYPFGLRDILGVNVKMRRPDLAEAVDAIICTLAFKERLVDVD